MNRDKKQGFFVSPVSHTVSEKNQPTVTLQQKCAAAKQIIYVNLY